jgi:hypothetical protein
MRTAEVLREAWRDLASGAGGAVTCAVVLAVLLAGVVGLRTAAATEDVRAAARFVTSGAATQVFTAEGRIDGAACEALADDADVLASGAVRRIEDGMVVAALPGTSVPTYEVSGGFTALVDVEGVVGGSGVVASAEVADTLGVEPGERIESAQGRVPVAGVYAWPDDGRDPDLGYAVLSPAIDDGTPFDACWATIWPADDTALTGLRRTLLPSTSAEDDARSTSGQLNPRSGTTFTPAAAPPSGVVETVVLGIGLAVGLGAVIRRRLSIASDRHVGVTVGAQALGIGIHQGAWASVGAALAVAASVVLVRGLPVADAWPIVVHAVVLCALGLLGAATGGVAGVALVRERSLHRYFRTR